MVFKNVKLMFWVDAVLCVVYLRNRSPTHALNNKTPYEMFLRSDISGCLAPLVMP